MKTIKPGSIWLGSNQEPFVVINVVELDGHTWVHYRKQTTKEPHEYSCYAESFLLRFSENVNNKYQHFL
jgi:hypothetical protein